MNHTYWEKIKLTILIVLMATSLMQVGILWSYKIHGTPFYFAGSMFGGNGSKPVSETVNMQKVKDSYFMPYRMIASRGFNEYCWDLRKGDPTYHGLWNEFRSRYLETMLKSTPQFYKQDSEQLSEWASLVLKGGFVFEFRTSIPMDIVAWLSGVEQVSQGGPNGIYKVILLPNADINYNLTVYALEHTRESGYKIYKYVLPFDAQGLSKQDYDNVIQELAEDRSLRTYSITKEFFTKKVKFDIRQDILLAVEMPKSSKIYNIGSSVPEMIREKETSEIFGLILGKDNGSYTDSVDTSNTVEFRNLNNVYKVYKDGLMEYRYRSPQEQKSMGGRREAFEKAVLFINEKKLGSFDPEVELYLSGVMPDYENQSYIFTFDYTVDNVPVVFNGYKPGVEGVGPLDHAVTIRATGKKVMECFWILRDFEKEKAHPYNVHFEDFVEDASLKLGNYRNFNFKDIDISYEINAQHDTGTIKPSWIITTKDSQIISIPMRTVKGDK